MLRSSLCETTRRCVMPKLRPRQPIRRFDVFAEYNRVKNEASGMPGGRAKGDAIWLAKVVAGRRGGVSHAAPPEGATGGMEHLHEERREGEFHSAGGVPQTDRTFDHEIV